MDDLTSSVDGVRCPTPHAENEHVLLGHGSGGRMGAAIVRDLFLAHFSNDLIEKLTDAAVIDMPDGSMAVSTDTFVVQPLEFPGGDIGSLSVHGTLNDVAMMGGQPLYLTAGFVLEEGLPFDQLDRVVASMAKAATDAGVPIICGDTKVVEHGKADGLYINTTGIGHVDPHFSPAPEKARVGDVVVVSGEIGRHGIAVMAVREGLEFEVEIESDAATLWPLVELLKTRIGDSVHVLRDPTRGGVASALNEIAQTARVGVSLVEQYLPIPEPVTAACELLGFDTLYVANEGVLIALVEEEVAEDTVNVLRQHPLGKNATAIGLVVDTNPGIVALETSIGGTRVVDMLPGDQLPRIC